jgi:hypothetical protein
MPYQGDQEDDDIYEHCLAFNCDISGCTELHVDDDDDALFVDDDPTYNNASHAVYIFNEQKTNEFRARLKLAPSIFQNMMGDQTVDTKLAAELFKTFDAKSKEESKTLKLKSETAYVATFQDMMFFVVPVVPQKNVKNKQVVDMTPEELQRSGDHTTITNSFEKMADYIKRDWTDCVRTWDLCGMHTKQLLKCGAAKELTPAMYEHIKHINYQRVMTIYNMDYYAEGCSYRQPFILGEECPWLRDTCTDNQWRQKILKFKRAERIIDYTVKNTDMKSTDKSCAVELVKSFTEKLIIPEPVGSEFMTYTQNDKLVSFQLPQRVHWRSNVGTSTGIALHNMKLTCPGQTCKYFFEPMIENLTLFLKDTEVKDAKQLWRLAVGYCYWESIRVTDCWNEVKDGKKNHKWFVRMDAMEDDAGEQRYKPMHPRVRRKRLRENPRSKPDKSHETIDAIGTELLTVELKDVTYNRALMKKIHAPWHHWILFPNFGNSMDGVQYSEINKTIATLCAGGSGSK